MDANKRKFLLLFILGLIPAISLADPLTYDDFIAWVSEAKVVEISKVSGIGEYKYSGSISLNRTDAKEFESLLNRSTSYYNGSHRCPYKPGLRVIMKRGEKQMHLLFCFSCNDFSAFGDVGKTEIKSFAPMASELHKLYLKHYP